MLRLMTLPADDLFDVRFLLDEDHRAVQAAVARFTDERVLALIAEAFEHGRFPRELVPEMAGLGLFGATLPAEYGGGGLDAISMG